MAIEKETLGNAIKSVRTARGLTQVQLAEAAGLSKDGKSVALIEQGKRFVSIKTLNTLAEALRIPPGCLAILGSRNVGENKAATELLLTLQKLVSTVLVAQSELEIEERAEEAKQKLVSSQQHNTIEVAKLMKSFSLVEKARGNPKQLRVAPTQKKKLKKRRVAEVH